MKRNNFVRRSGMAPCHRVFGKWFAALTRNLEAEYCRHSLSREDSCAEHGFSPAQGFFDPLVEHIILSCNLLHDLAHGERTLALGPNTLQLFRPHLGAKTPPVLMCCTTPGRLVWVWLI